MSDLKEAVKDAINAAGYFLIIIICLFLGAAVFSGAIELLKHWVFWLKSFSNI